MNVDTQSLIQQTKNRIGELEALVEAERRVVSGNGWCVVSAHGFPIKFEIQGTRVFGASTSNIEGATRLSRQNALHLAASMKDGTGAAGKAMPYVQAIHDSISDAQALMQTLQGEKGRA